MDSYERLDTYEIAREEISTAISNLREIDTTDSILMILEECKRHMDLRINNLHLMIEAQEKAEDEELEAEYWEAVRIT